MLSAFYRDPSLFAYAMTHPSSRDISTEHFRRRKVRFASYDGSPRTTRMGFQLVLNPEDDYISMPVYCDGVYEGPTTNLLAKQLRPGMTVVDLGANLGYFTILSSFLVRDGPVYAFEPVPHNFSLLQKNIQINRRRCISPFRLAVSNVSGMADLYLSGTNPGDHRLAPEPGEARASVSIATTRMDDVFGSERRVDLVKIDVQGAEGRCLEGMEMTIRSNPSLKIIMEFWPYGLERQGTSVPHMLELIESLDLEIREVTHYGLPMRYRRRLLERYSVESREYTNLFLSRGVR